MNINDSLYHKIKFILHDRIQLLFSDLYINFILKFNKSQILSNFFLYTPIKFNKNNQINIVFQNKGVFNEEITYLFNDIDNINLIRLNRRVLKKLLNSSYNNKNINHLNWYQEKNKIENLHKYRNLLKRFIGIPKYNIFLIFNWGDGSTAEFTEYLKLYKIHTICIHKEGISSKVFRESYLNIINKKRIKFLGKKIFVYNQVTKQTLLKSFYKDEDIDVVGSVRFDHIFSLQNQRIDQKKVLIFHPSVNAQLPDLLGLNCNFNWEELTNIFYNTLFKLLNDFPSINFVVKIKNRDIENISKYITKPVKNLIIDRSTSSIDLLKDSKLCIGFNSTALIESSAFNIPTINFVPEHIYKKYNDYIIEYKSLVINTADYDLIKNKIALNTIRTKPDKVKLNDLNEIVGNNTGNVKEIIVESVINLINDDKI